MRLERIKNQNFCNLRDFGITFADTMADGISDQHIS